MTTHLPNISPFISSKPYSELIFIKLGGSLITDKDKPLQAQTDLLLDLLNQLGVFLIQYPDTRVILGHGSGSFGHYMAKLYGTRDGVRDEMGWQGYHDVWRKARELHDIVMACGLDFDLPLPLISFPPSASVSASNRQITTWNLEPMTTAIDNGLIPVVYGDVVYDDQLGGTILSTEELFVDLASVFKPERVLLFGKTEGVYEDFPNAQNIIPHISSETILPQTLGESDSPDVTGGMMEKVRLMQKLCALSPETEVRICCGSDMSKMMDALIGKETGTLITHK